VAHDRDDLIDGIDEGEELVGACATPDKPATLADLACRLDRVVKALSQLPRARRRRPEQLAYGTTKAAPATGVNAQAQPVTLVNTPDSDVEDRDYVVTIQALALPPGFGGVAPSSTCGSLEYTIDYSQGESNYSLSGTLADLEAHTTDICARRITVSVAWINYSTTPTAPKTAPAPLPVTASAGATKATHARTLPSALNWYQSPLYNSGGPTAPQLVASANPSIVVPAAGQFRAMYGTIATGTGTMYVQLLDSPSGTAPVNGAIPIWTSDSLCVGDSYASFDAREQTAWIYGLWVCLSSTPATLTIVVGTWTTNLAGG